MRLLPFAVPALAAACLAGCGGSGHSGSTRTATILTARVQPTTFAQVRTGILALYKAHPNIDGFVTQDVEYTPATRDKVLGVCRSGGPERSARALESTRVLACAPLVFFFYRYGKARSVQDSIDVAQSLYWYAVRSNERPYDAGPGLENLLHRWGVR